jgi:hypothetical protein
VADHFAVWAADRQAALRIVDQGGRLDMYGDPVDCVRVADD